MDEQVACVHELCVRTIRLLAADMVDEAGSGHLGAVFSLASAMDILWGDILHFKRNWPNRDRFVLSCGHASSLLYVMLHFLDSDSEHGIGLGDLRCFRKLDSKTPGHPEKNDETGVEATTGPLGQGFANAVGMAIAESYLSCKFAKFGPIFDHRTYVVFGDGCLMEGITQEAISLAGHLRLYR